MEDFSQWSLAASAVKLTIYVSSFMAAGSLLFLLVVRPTGSDVRRTLMSVSMITAVVAIFASLLRVMVQAGRLMDDGWAGMLDAEIIGYSLEGPLGLSTYVRCTGLVFVICAAALPKLRPFIGVLGAVLVAMSFAMTGHATQDPRWWLIILLTVHLLAASFWFGALVPLYQLCGNGNDFTHAVKISERFGQQATVVVPVLLFVGAAFAYLTVGSWQNLFTTNYGWALLTKLGFVSCVLTIAVANKLRFVPALLTGGEAAALSFRRALKIEFVLFVLIFAATAILTTTFTLPE